MSFKGHDEAPNLRLIYFIFKHLRNLPQELVYIKLNNISYCSVLLYTIIHFFFMFEKF